MNGLIVISYLLSGKEESPQQQLRVIGYLLVVIRGAKKRNGRFENVLIESAPEWA